MSVFGLQVRHLWEMLLILEEWDPQDPFSRKKKMLTSSSFTESPSPLLEDDHDFLGIQLQSL
ncbi:MAG: hypothetical protein CM15mP130_1020 [Verrucomicrobiota bacterium]|nr:MAG: hypothetical protein CM15mP130_1020 [Verrucomicrobiota bacterium]